MKRSWFFLFLKKSWHLYNEVYLRWWCTSTSCALYAYVFVCLPVGPEQWQHQNKTKNCRIWFPFDIHDDYDYLCINSNTNFIATNIILFYNCSRHHFHHNLNIYAQWRLQCDGLIPIAKTAKKSTKSKIRRSHRKRKPKRPKNPPTKKTITAINNRSRRCRWPPRRCRRLLPIEISKKGDNNHMEAVVATITMVEDEARTDRSSRSTVTPTKIKIKIEEEQGQRIGKNWQKHHLDSRAVRWFIWLVNSNDCRNVKNRIALIALYPYSLTLLNTIQYNTTHVNPELETSISTNRFR